MRLELRAEGRCATTYHPKRDIRAFGNLVGDRAAVHRNRKLAAMYELIAPPIIGTHLAGIALQVAQLSYLAEGVQQRMTFIHPVYPRMEVQWTSIVEGETTRVTATQNDRIKAEFRYTPLDSHDENPETPWCTSSHSIEPKQLRLFLKRTGGVSPLAAAHGLAYAIIPATLITLIQSRCADKDVFALHRSSTVANIAPITAGNAEVRIYQAQEKKTRDGNAYNFKGEVVQNDQVVTRAKLVCLSRQPIDLQRLRDPI